MFESLRFYVLFVRVSCLNKLETRNLVVFVLVICFGLPVFLYLCFLCVFGSVRHCVSVFLSVGFKKRPRIFVRGNVRPSVRNAFSKNIADAFYCPLGVVIVIGRFPCSFSNAPNSCLAIFLPDSGGVFLQRSKRRRIRLGGWRDYLRPARGGGRMVGGTQEGERRRPRRQTWRISV